MNIRKLIPYIIVVALGILLLNLIATAQLHMHTSAQNIDTNAYVMWHMIGVAFAFLLGVLTEWPKVLKLVKKELRIGFSALCVFGILLFSISLIPPSTFLMLFGINFPFTYGGGSFSLIAGAMTHSSIVQYILSVVAGGMVIKGLTQKISAAEDSKA
ncbi:MAG: hypothetical protein ACOWWO_05415 [Peptococcaceae bacterium]